MLLPWVTYTTYLSSTIITEVIFIILSKYLTDKLFSIMHSVDRWFSALPTSVILPGALGLIIGLIISYLFTGLINGIHVPWLSAIITFITYITFCYFGIHIAIKRKSGIHFFNFLKSHQQEKSKTDGTSHCKIFDTSAIIDGRIFDLCKTGFIEGTIIVPDFVLDERRNIADSPENLKRAKGRRGLDMLNKIQRELKLSVNIVHTEYNKEMEIDSRLLRLAEDMGGKILTIDYNLNKVATVWNIPVLNINELANALKMVLLPGEVILVKIIREGKELGQGLAYLEDGTIVVVENAASRRGSDLYVEVRSVLQTVAGRMIFADIKTNKDTPLKSSRLFL